ncbi:sugar-binding domain-containing protein [Verrucomicrobiota bacterium]
MRRCLTVAGCVLLSFVCCMAAELGIGRQIVSLDGQWQITEGDYTTVPQAAEFVSTVPVPGLADLAKPAFKAVGYVSESKKLRECFWYRKTFKIKGDVRAVARLKFHKVKYGCSVYLNGQHIGDVQRNFTPLYFDVTKALKGNGAENELIVRVGAHIGNQMNKDAPYGRDKEKEQYIPGIYDSVELIMTGDLYLKHIQIAPGPNCDSILLETSVFNTLEKEIQYHLVEYSVKDADGKVVTTEKKYGQFHATCGIRPREKSANVIHGIRWDDMKLWTPENPYLYTIDVKLYSIKRGPNYHSQKNKSDVVIKLKDSMTTRFGVRSFWFDRETGKPVLNGEPYVLLGTSVTIFRFFQDKNRGNLPWDREWVRKLIREYKKMNWNCARFTIGFPPDFWYDIADEEGFLIQDEYPIWDFPKQTSTDFVIDEFKAWMRQRWNHPSVIIWDAQNESYSYGMLPYAVSQVRGLDLSDRPWDIGWDGSIRATDPVECHHYPFKGWQKGPYRPISEVAKNYVYKQSIPYTSRGAKPKSKSAPHILNEYCSFWVNRDGSYTWLSKHCFDEIIGTENHTKDQRCLTAALYTSMLTEAFRRCVNGGIMQFCGLSYSNPGGNQRNGATSDNLCQLNPPKFDPYFEEYVKDSFARVAMTLDIWEQEFKPGASFNAPLLVHNDSGENWKGEVTLFLYDGNKVIQKKSQQAEVEAHSKKEMSFDGFTAPEKNGTYRLESELFHEKESVRSRRRIYVSRP